MGLINKQMAPVSMNQAPVEGMEPDNSMMTERMQGATPESGDTSGKPITSKNVRSQMQLPKGMAEPYDRIVKAGIKMMFDPSTREETMQFMEQSGGDPAQMAEGVSSVMAALFQQSNETMPPTLIIPAGVELLVHAVEVAKGGGMEVSDQQIAEGMGQMVEQIFTKFGVSPEEMQSFFAGGQQGGKPTGPPPQGQPGQGVVGGNMPQGV
jgi:hypothetical protein